MNASCAQFSKDTKHKAGLMNPAAAVANGLLAASLLFTPALDVVHGNGFSAGGNANAQVRTKSNSVLWSLRRSLRSMRAAARNWHTA